MEPRLYSGCCGWNYEDWIGPFYPPGAQQGAYLGLYAERFAAVEVDSTWYAVPPVERVRKWAATTPDSFRFAPKLVRTITHELRLAGAGCRAELDSFCDVLRHLGDKLGPVLIQLPPDFGPGEAPVLEHFLSLLPEDMRFAVEFRDPGWFTADTFAVLQERSVALAVTDGVPGLPRVDVTTADFAYIRFLGDRQRIEVRMRADNGSARFHKPHSGFEKDLPLQWWATVARRMLGRGLAVFGFFNNHYEGHAPASLRKFHGYLGIHEEPWGQLDLF